jgi:alpha-beta hydrolase superfamily lysophospholipase
MTEAIAQEPAPVSPRKRLVVLVPGIGGDTRLWQPLVDRIEKEPPFSQAQVTWLRFDHKTRWFGMGRLDSLGKRLNALVAAEWLRSGGYDDILLIGHSMGGLVVRQAYLLAAGGVADVSPSAWSARVSRIVLMASLNRGIDLRTASWPERLMAYLARVVPFVPHFTATDILRGSDFLTNLRIDWIRHFRTPAPASGAPTVIQVLGTSDGLVNADDSKDILAFPDGHYLEVPEANHRGVYRLDLTDDPELRYSVLRHAVLGDFASKAAAQEDPVRRVVFLLHGIRASNVDGWVEGLEKRIKAREGARVVVRNPTYGYFSAARFALPSVRRKNIRVFQDWYTEELAKHPAAEFDIIAHSNGTYILGHSLLRTPGMRFTNVALAGSVLPQDFLQRFRNLERQVGRIRNDRANRDWPVALLCNALSGIRMKDVGTAGFSGFLGGMTDEVAYYAGGHGEALKEERLDMLAGFALGDTTVEPTGLTTPGYYQQLSNSMPYVAKAAVLGLMVGVGFLVFWGGTFHIDHAMWTLLALTGLYVLLDII